MSKARSTWIGWWLFVVSAGLFGVSALRARDWVALAGATAFLFANISFMVGLCRDDTHRSRASDSNSTPAVEHRRGASSAGVDAGTNRGGH